MNDDRDSLIRQSGRDSADRAASALISAVISSFPMRDDRELPRTRSYQTLISRASSGEPLAARSARGGRGAGAVRSRILRANRDLQPCGVRAIGVTCRAAESFCVQSSCEDAAERRNLSPLVRCLSVFPRETSIARKLHVATPASREPRRATTSKTTPIDPAGLALFLAACRINRGDQSNGDVVSNSMYLFIIT